MKYTEFNKNIMLLLFVELFDMYCRIAKNRMQEGMVIDYEKIRNFYGRRL